MTCCVEQKNHRPYRAETAPKWAISYVKCGGARLATPQEAEAAEVAARERAQ